MKLFLSATSIFLPPFQLELPSSLESNIFRAALYSSLMNQGEQKHRAAHFGSVDVFSLAVIPFQLQFWRARLISVVYASVCSASIVPKPGERCVSGLLNRRSSVPIDALRRALHSSLERLSSFSGVKPSRHFDGQAVAEFRLVCAAGSVASSSFLVTALKLCKPQRQRPAPVVLAVTVPVCRCGSRQPRRRMSGPEVIGRGVKFMTDGCDQCLTFRPVTLQEKPARFLISLISSRWSL